MNQQHTLPTLRSTRPPAWLSCLAMMLVAGGVAHAEVIARTNAGPITRAMLVDFVAPQSLADSPERLTLHAERMAFSIWLSEQGRAMGVHEQPEVALMALRERLALLRDAMIDAEAFREDPAGEENLVAYYEETRRRFPTQGWFELRHIFIQAATHEREAARPRAQAALDRLRAGEDFQTVARELCDAAQDAPDDRGRVIRVGRPQLNPALAAALDELEPGQVSDIVEIEHGLEILQLEENQPAGFQTLESVRERLTQELRTRARNQARLELDQRARAADVYEFFLETFWDEQSHPRAVILRSATHTLRKDQIRTMFFSENPDAPADSMDEMERGIGYLSRLDQAFRMAAYAERLGIDQQPEVAQRLKVQYERDLGLRTLERMIAERVADATPEGLRAFYDDPANAALFQRPRETQGLAIFVPFDYPPGAGPPEQHFIRQERRAEIEEIYADLQAGASPTVYAAAYPDWSSADEQGRLPLAAVHDPFFDRAVADLEPGQFSEPREITQRGYAIFVLTQAQQPDPPAFDQAQDEIRAIYQRQQERRIHDQLREQALAEVGFELTP